MPPPPSADMTELLKYAEIGDIQELRRKLFALKEADPRWQPFADRLLESAQRFELRDIRTILEEALATERMTMQERMAALPLELRTRLYDSASIANIVEIEKSILEIRDIDTRLADTLYAWAQAFDYGKMLALLEEAAA